MHKSLNLTNTGGVYTYQNTWKFIQDAYGGAIDAMAAGFGNKLVITGCEDTGSDVADGWVVIDGELMPFVGGPKPLTPMVQVQQTIANAAYNDGNLKPFYYTKVAALVSIGDFDYVDLKRLPGNKGMFQSILDLQTTVQKVVNVEDAVILDGCVVSAVDTGASTLQISAGYALMAGVLVEVPEYIGTYGVYLTKDGTWTNALPTAPYILFDPYTSQRYADVMRRALTPLGEIKMFETLSDRFVAGVGKWEMKGFSLMASMQGRTPLGLFWNGVAVPNVTDPAYTTAGNQGGGRTVSIAKTNLPAVGVDVPIPESATSTTDSGSGARVAIGNDGTEPGGGPTLTSDNLGDGTPMDVVNPYTVIVYAKRTV